VPREKLLHILVGAVIAIAVVVPLGAFAYVKSGIYNVGASHPHTKFTTWLTHETMIHSVRRHAAGIRPPPWTSADQLVAGFCAYQTHCAACHGAAGIPRQTWVAGLEPQPPYLLDVTQRFTPAQLFWIAKNGIKMTGMPAWRDTLSDRELWNVVAWLDASSRLEPQIYKRWALAKRCGATIGLSPPSPGSATIPRP
jgi:mono/diheme cytochrome c family protein